MIMISMELGLDIDNDTISRLVFLLYVDPNPIMPVWVSGSGVRRLNFSIHQFIHSIHLQEMSWLLRRWLKPEENTPPPPPAPSIPPSASTPAPTTTNTPAPSPTTTDNTTVPKNVKLLLTGLLLFSLSTLATRRTLLRKHTAGIPPFYTSNPHHNPRVNGALDAFEALNLATVNTVSAAMIAGGGALCVLDVDSVEGARAKFRRRRFADEGNGTPPTKEEEEQFERDVEAWLANVLDSKDVREVRRRVESARK